MKYLAWPDKERRRGRCEVDALGHFTTTSYDRAGLAQLPTADNVVITPIQLAMIGALARIQGSTLQEAAGPTLLSSLAASVIGRGISQVVVGWIPLYGNAVNATTAASVTEAIGWAAFKYFEKEAKT
jgi:uncharacterized protein (DUF697 family)